MNEHPLEYVSTVQTLMDTYEFLDDDDFAQSMDIALKFIVKPDVPPQMAANLVLKMQAYATKFKMQATYYAHINPGRAGTEENKKKNVYYSVSDCCDKLAGAIKYLARDN